jgi:hypothetical protein
VAQSSALGRPDGGYRLAARRAGRERLGSHAQILRLDAPSASCGSSLPQAAEAVAVFLQGQDPLRVLGQRPTSRIVSPSAAGAVAGRLSEPPAQGDLVDRAAVAEGHETETPGAIPTGFHKARPSRPARPLHDGRWALCGPSRRAASGQQG